MLCDNVQRGTGAARGIRTPDPLITNQVLYQLSYSGFKVLLFREARARCQAGGGNLSRPTLEVSMLGLADRDARNGLKMKHHSTRANLSQWTRLHCSFMPLSAARLAMSPRAFLRLSCASYLVSVWGWVRLFCCHISGCSSKPSPTKACWSRRLIERMANAPITGESRFGRDRSGLRQCNRSP